MSLVSTVACSRSAWPATRAPSLTTLPYALRGPSHHSEDWWECTIASWRHSIWVGVYDPWPVVRRPWVWYKTLRDGICLERFHRSFDTGLMGYGMVRARKSTEGYMVKDVTM